MNGHPYGILFASLTPGILWGILRSNFEIPYVCFQLPAFESLALPV
jgi:hypothetical protein